MRRARFDLEEQVGGLVHDERYDLRRPSHPEADAAPWDWADAPQRPLQIRAARVSERPATRSTAA